MISPDAAPLLYREILKIATHPNWEVRERTLALATLLERLFFEVTKQEQIAFSTLFARISYVGHQYNIQPDTLRIIHTFRRTATRVRDGWRADEKSTALGIQAAALSVLVLSEAAIPADIIALWDDFPRTSAHDETGELTFAASIRCVAIRDEPEHNCLIVIDQDNPSRPVRVRYGLPERNENFNPTIQVIRKVFGFPVSLQLLEVDLSPNGDYRPRVIVVEPDYLVDVSAIAECFKDTGPEPYAYLVRKFLPQETTEPILLGNIANFFLDRLLNEPDTPWQALFRETFQLYPFAYAAMADAEVRTVSNKAQKHYSNLKNMASGGFAKQGIEPENCVLEPTFFSNQYGIQGRLDLFYRTEEKSAIVELKSGTPFKPNSYGIQRSHFTQTLLYDLLVRSVFGHAADPAKYILYSGADVNHLRFAPTIAPEQWEALQLRNQLVALERLLTKIQPGDAQVPVFGRLRGSSGKGFLERDFGRFEVAYTRLSLLARKYFNAFVGFTAREHWLAKIGEENADTLNGHAALWRSGFSDKQQSFSILSHLEIVENHADKAECRLVFRKTAHTNPLANFRIGDIAVLYPASADTDTVLDYQVIKCIITALNKDTVIVQLRYRQFNLKPFQTEGHWNLEPDLMDTGFTGMYRGLLEWAEGEATGRDLIMGAIPPREPEVPAASTNHTSNGLSVTLTAEQQALFQKITHSKDYFLLWGPPGTGKTSVMLHVLADWVLRETDDNVLLLAYTNRAVDEICEALDALGGTIRDQYLRMGSRYATAERFRDQLLSAKIAGVSTRAELRAVLDKRRIFVSTVASFSQNEGLLRLKKFQRLVVDEASQILEPQLVGLLTRFEHFILIGDHRQLPAITTQRPATTVVEDADLHTIGLTDLRDSYFERLYRRCETEGWHWAYGSLSHQGRMHTDIMAFPNRHFYGNLLRTLPLDNYELGITNYGGTALGTEDVGGNEPVSTGPQHVDLFYDRSGHYPDLEAIFAEHRVVFWPSVPEDSLPGQKTNRNEAEQVVQLVQFFKKLFAINGMPWHATKTLGIITPWRAQIAQIRASLAAANLDPDELSIDTVERYQGGARDVIILSTCVNSETQLSQLVNLSGEGVDRKLNVALTRARQHVIVLGNESILRLDERYRAFIEAYTTVPAP